MTTETIGFLKEIIERLESGDMIISSINTEERVKNQALSMNGDRTILSTELDINIKCTKRFTK